MVSVQLLRRSRKCQKIQKLVSDLKIYLLTLLHDVSLAIFVESFFVKTASTNKDPLSLNRVNTSKVANKRCLFPEGTFAKYAIENSCIGTLCTNSWVSFTFVTLIIKPCKKSLNAKNMRMTRS